MSERATDSTLRDARIEIVNGTRKGTEIPVLFNPTEYTMSKSLQYGEHEIAGLSTPVTQFVSGDAETLSMELFLDARRGSRGIVEHVADIDRLLEIDEKLAAPPVCRFLWGPLAFTAVLESVERQFTLFDAGGVPVRARLNVTFTEYRFPSERDQGRWESVDRTRARQATEGETLPEIAAGEYGDPGKWRLIADANDINDPNDVPPGEELVIPPVSDE